MEQDYIIKIKDVSVEFPMMNGTIHAVNHVDFNVRKNYVTALVGESGSGKSTLASTLLNMVSSPGRISTGEVFYNKENILKLDKEVLRQYKWRDVSMVFQAAQSALNPLLTIGDQMTETFKVHDAGKSIEEINERCKVLLEYVRLEADRVLNCYPHELSGGMKQRVMIAFAMLLNPQLMILDEPTTALDVITQDYIFNILLKIHKEMNMTMLLLTHDIAVVAKVADYIGVMYAGNLVEYGTVYDIFNNPKHEYTRRLIESAPSLVGELVERQGIVGAPPNLMDPPKGCAFYPRCTGAQEICKKSKPPTVKLDENHFVQCHLCANSKKAVTKEETRNE